MVIPSYGAAPLSATFLLVRGLQLISMVVILGLTGNFVNEMIMANLDLSKEIVGTLSITAIASLYTLVSIAFYWAEANVGLYIMAGIDFMILIAWIVVSVTIGKPISNLNCFSLGMVVKEGVVTGKEVSTMLSLLDWTGMSKSNCFGTKAIWGFSVALAILYFTSCILLPTLHFKNKKAGGYAKYAV